MNKPSGSDDFILEVLFQCADEADIRIDINVS